MTSSPCFFTPMSWDHILPAAAEAQIMTVEQICRYIEDGRNIGFCGWSTDGVPLLKCWITPEHSQQFVRQTKLRRPDQLILEVICSRKIRHRMRPRRYEYLQKLIDFNCELALEVCQLHGQNQHFKILFREQEMRKFTSIPCPNCVPACGNVSFIESEK